MADVMAENNSATAKRLQMKKNSGQLESPAFETTQGFSVTVTYESSANISITETGTDNTITGASPLTLEVSSLNAGVTIQASSATTYITEITVAPASGVSLQDPALAFTDITGNITKMLTDGSYSSAATTASDATITYSSSNQEVATISQEGLVALIGRGKTTIKAEVEETAAYKAASVEYTLTVLDPDLAQTFTKVTSGAITDGQYIIVYQDGNDATSVVAMNNTNTKDYFECSTFDLIEGNIVTDESTIVWNIAQNENGTYTISNNGNFVTYTNDGTATNLSSEANNYSYWNITPASDNTFQIANHEVSKRLLRYNSNAAIVRFASYSNTGSEKDPTLYKLNSGKQAVTVAFNEVSGNKELFFAEGITYNSAATATPERPITYSSSNQDVATISTEGIVTVVGPGTTIIKAIAAGDDTYEEGAAQYTLTVRASSVTLPYSTDFKSGLGDWISIATTGTAQWESDAQYGARISGYINNKNTESEVYLISPVVTANNIILNFSTWFNYDGNALELLYSTDYNPSTMQPTDATWNDITENAVWPTATYKWEESGNIELKDLTSPIRFAFRYTSTTEGASTWEITDLSIKEGVSSAIETVEANGMKIINGKGQVTIETAEAARVAVYALTGAQVRQLNLTEGTNVVELPAGIYVIGRQKVVVF